MAVFWLVAGGRCSGRGADDRPELVRGHADAERGAALPEGVVHGLQRARQQVHLVQPPRPERPLLGVRLERLQRRRHQRLGQVKALEDLGDGGLGVGLQVLVDQGQAVVGLVP